MVVHSLLSRLLVAAIVGTFHPMPIWLAPSVISVWAFAESSPIFGAVFCVIAGAVYLFSAFVVFLDLPAQERVSYETNQEDA
jgi:hypothetical protein